MSMDKQYSQYFHLFLKIITVLYFLYQARSIEKMILLVQNMIISYIIKTNQTSAAIGLLPILIEFYKT